MTEFRMPSLGADMETGTVLEWLVSPGDTVHRGDLVAVVDTDKAAVEVEVFEDGVVGELLVPVGQRVPVGTPLASLAPLGTAAPPAAAAVPTAAVPAAVAPAAAAPVPAAIAVTSPLVRHLAHQQGIDLATVRGTGTDGAVTREDLAAAAPPPPGPAATAVPPADLAAAVPPPPGPAATAVPPAAERLPGRASPYARRRAAALGVDLASVAPGPDGVLRAADVERAAGAPPAAAPPPVPRARTAAHEGAGSGPAAGGPSGPERRLAMRRAIATLMSRSNREVPHYHLATTVDLQRALAWLHAANAGRAPSERLLPAALLLKAVAAACAQVPDVNGFWRDDAHVPSEAVHVGVAVSLRGGGLVTPALLHADRLSLDELMAGLRDLVARSRTGRLRRAELTDATITVTELGDQGVELVHGVIYPPQVALVGFGRVVERPVAVDGMVGVRPTVTMTLAADHRASDGHVGGRYLTAVDRLLQHPEELREGRP